MRSELTDDELKRGWELHDAVKNHPYRVSFEPALMEEYGDLVSKMIQMVATYVQDPDGTYPFHDYVTMPIKETWREGSPIEELHIDVYSNPNIGLLNRSVHDYNGIKWSLASRYKSNSASDMTTEIVKTKFIETTELQLMLFHKLLLGEEITTVKFPSDRGYINAYTEHTLAKNPHFDNWWTHECWLKDEYYDY